MAPTKLQSNYQNAQQEDFFITLLVLYSLTLLE